MLRRPVESALAALIRMKQHLLWLAALFVGHVEGLDYQLGIRFGGERPANHPTRVQIQRRGQIMPTTLRPNVGDVAAPHLVRALDSEIAVQSIRDIRALNCCLLICVRARLLADEAQLTHQPAHTETADRHAFLAQHAQDASATS